MQILNASRSQLEAKFGRKTVSSHILELQERGTPMKLDSGGSWVPGLSGQDPNGADDITGVKTARDLTGATDYEQETIDFLKQHQLSRRVQCFLSATGISQRKLAKKIYDVTLVTPSFYSAPVARVPAVIQVPVARLAPLRPGMGVTTVPEVNPIGFAPGVSRHRFET